MESVLAHFQSFYVYYIFGGLLLLPALFFTRRYSVPLILYSVESIIYCGIMHILVGCLVRVTAWFKDQSSMKRAFNTKDLTPPTWSTPWLEFWNREAYDPAWIVWFELVLAVIIVGAVWYLRPMKIQRKKKDRKFANEGASRGRPGAPRAGLGKTPGRGRR